MHTAASATITFKKNLQLPPDQLVLSNLRRPSIVAKGMAIVVKEIAEPIY